MRPAASDGDGSKRARGGSPADDRLSVAAKARAWVESGRSRAEELLATNEHRPLVDVGKRLYERDKAFAGTVMGSAIAFRLFLFFVPLLVFLVGLAGIIGSWGVDAEDVNENAAISGGMATQIRAAFGQPGSSSWIATLSGLFFMATTGRTLSKVMIASSAMAWRLPPSRRASIKVVGALVGLVAGIGLLVVLMSRLRAAAGLGVVSVSFLAVFGIQVVLWLLVSSLLPRATSDRSVLLPGAVLVALTVTVMQAVSQLYLPDRIGRASEIYGAIGATVVTLGWFFILGRVIVLGMCVNAVIFERFGGIAQFVFSLPVLRSIAKRSATIRRYFGLDESHPAPPPDGG
jgi:uncharacterized BrkB/YihY/UPF0761 family membrane protein